MKLKPLFPLLMLVRVRVSGCRAGEAQTPGDTGEIPYGGILHFLPSGITRGGDESVDYRQRKGGLHLQNMRQCSGKA